MPAGRNYYRSFASRIFSAIRRRLTSEYRKTQSYWEERGKEYHNRTLSPCYERMYDELAELVIRRAPNSVIEFGCGDALLLRRLNSKGYTGKLFGLDYVTSQIEFARSVLPECEFSVQDIQKTNYADKQFDLAICVGTIMYLSTQQFARAANELNRIARSVLIVEMTTKWMTPQKREQYLSVPTHHEHDIAEILAKSGFRIIEDRRFDYFWDPEFNPQGENGYNMTLATSLESDRTRFA